MEKYIYKYQYNKNQYKMSLFEICGDERYKKMIFKNIKLFHIFIYVFDLSKDDDINEEYFNKINDYENDYIYGHEKIIYIVGNKLDLGVKNIEKFRKQAKILIDRGIIHKYFELSAKTNEGIDLFFENLKIYSAIILDNNILEPSITNVENIIESSNKNIKRNMKYNLLKYQIYEVFVIYKISFLF
jgi:GTPase SAR1 family protein